MDDIPVHSVGKQETADPVDTKAARLLALFEGNHRHHGEFYTKGKVVEGEKVEKSKAVTVTPGPSVELWQRHLRGDFILGVVPIQDDATCRWGAIDIDQYQKFEHRALAKRLVGTPLVVCRSKSGGAHVYCFTSEPVPAKVMRAKLAEIAAALGHKGVEIFPKQEWLDPAKDSGNWINMPYSNDRVTTLQYGVTENAELKLDQFLDNAESKRVTMDVLKAITVVPAPSPENASDFADGPPCLQALAKSGIGEGERNKGLFNVAVYLKKAFPDDWAARLLDYNQRMAQPPLPLDELRVVAKSLNKKDYFYTCKEEPICSVCDKDVCRTRRFGIGTETYTPIPFVVVNAAHINATDYGEPRWCVVSLIPEGLVILGGKPKMGKSSLMRQLCAAVAEGSDFLGKFPVVKGRVLYMALEDNERRIKRAYQRLRGDAGIPEDIDLVFRSNNVDQGGINDIKGWIDDHPDARLVVIDTLMKVRAPKRSNQQNAYIQDSVLLSPLHALATETGVTIIVVHHFRKAQSDDPLDMISGSTGMSAVPDTVITMHRERREAHAGLFITGRDLEQEQDIILVGDRNTHAWRYEGAGRDVRTTDRQKQVIEALRTMGMASPTEICKHIGKPATDRGNIKEVLDQLILDDIVERVTGTKGKYRLVPDEQELPF